MVKMTEIADKIKNSSLLTDIFGRWPSFHDAEVISIELFRDPNGTNEPSLRAKIYVFEATPEVDSRGFFILKNHVLVTLIFRGIDDNSIAGFNQQNVLSDIAITDISSRQLDQLRYEVHFPSLFGVEAEFKCRAIEIEAVEPFAPREERSAPKAGAYKPG
jgi:Immunity protein 50